MAKHTMLNAIFKYGLKKYDRFIEPIGIEKMIPLFRLSF